MAAAGFLTLAGLIFNTVLDVSIIQFGQWYGAVKVGLENGWMLGRDFANIAIIGIFTFIAISMILNNQTYGTKSLVARVLIVAILINFSLLFTKLIIDVSHFVAREVYVVIDAQHGAAQATVGNSQQGQSYSASRISNSFMKFAGMSGALSSWDAIRQQQETQNDSGFLFSILSIVFFVAAALVLLYGSFVLVARMLVIVVLLITSALAFTTWLLPSFAEKPYGWSGWWSALLNNALFAPLFMILLWVTLNIAAGMQAAVTGAGGAPGTLGKLATSPAENIGALVTFILVLGMFYATVRVSNMLASGFATQVGGTLTGIVAGGLVAAPIFRGAAALGRGTVGQAASRFGGALQRGGASLDADSAFARRLGLGKLVSASGQAVGTLGKKDFNMLQSGLGKSLASNLGVQQSLLTGKKIGGYDGNLKKRAEAIGDRGEAAAKTRDQAAIDKVVETETKTQQAFIEQKKEIAKAEQAKEYAAQNLAAAQKKQTAIANERQNAEESVNMHKKAIESKEKEKMSIEARQKQDTATATERHAIELAKGAVEIEETKRRITSGEGTDEDTVKLKMLEASRAVLQRQQQAEIDTINERAKTRMGALATDIAQLNTRMKEAADQAAPKLAELDAAAAQTENEIKAAQDQVSAATRAHAQERAKYAQAEAQLKKDVESGAFDAGRIAQTGMGFNKAKLAEEARKGLSGKAGTKKLKDALKEFAASGEAPAPAPAPAPAAGSDAH